MSRVVDQRNRFIKWLDGPGVVEDRAVTAHEEGALDVGVAGLDELLIRRKAGRIAPCSGEALVAGEEASTSPVTCTPPRRIVAAAAPQPSHLHNRDLVDAEARLLESAQCSGAPTVATATVAGITQQNLPGRNHRRSVDQAVAVERTATSRRLIDVLVGPAEPGKQCLFLSQWVISRSSLVVPSGASRADVA